MLLESYNLRHGDSIALDGTENGLLELKRKAVRGIAVRDMVNDVSSDLCLRTALITRPVRAQANQNSAPIRTSSQ
jgi:hypothetical protein